MPTLTLVDHVAGDLAEAADVNSNYTLIENVVNALDRDNLDTRWCVGTATARFYTATAAGNSAARDVYFPVNAGTTNMVIIGFAYRNNMPAETRKYAMVSLTHADVAVDTIYSATAVPDACGYVDNASFDAAAPYAVVPATNKIRFTVDDTPGGATFNAGEYHEIDIYFATEIVKSSEL